MSSDSDLDFESADEDTNYDVETKNNNALSKISFLSGNNEDSTKFSGVYENKSLTFDSRVEVESDENIQNRESLKSEINVNETFSELTSKIHKNETEELNLKKFSNNLIDTQDVIDAGSNERSNKTEISQSIAQSDDCKIYNEKQRIPLRLEKKIKEKSQPLKQNSFEKVTDAFSTENQQKQSEVKPSSWGFGSWGTNLLSTAASSVSTFTNQVSQGIGTVIETVESTLGAPPADELAANLSKAKESDPSVFNKSEGENLELEVHDVNNSEFTSSILPNVSSWTKVFENTGSKVVMGGLNTLELIGKKTIDIITEGDPGLRKKRSVFADGITLSQILREAKDEADEFKQDSNSQGIDAIHYSQLFDEYQGLVHLEALEMLSKQSQAKLQKLVMRFGRNTEARKHMDEIKSICENIPLTDDTTDCENFEDFDTVCKKYVLELNLPFNVENLIKTQKKVNDVVQNYENTIVVAKTSEEIYHSAICSLVEFTAKSIETFHKMAELILVQPILEPSVENFATNLTGLTTVMCIEINNLSSRYHHCLEIFAEQPENSNSKKTVTTVITNLYVEASNSNRYIQDAFLLLVPVLQVCQLES